MKKAGIYSPYLDTLGGGERYVMTVAACLAKMGWQVDVFWDDKRIKSQIERRFGIDLGKINFVADIFKKNVLKKYQGLKNYDLVFCLSDGSLPFVFAKKNILHFQVPFHEIDGKGFLNQIKLKKVDEIVCNSSFTKKFIDKEYGVKSKVIYPPIAIDNFKPIEKEKIILYVGRFTDLMHSKRQDVLLEVFKKMFDENKKVRDWRLVLAGGAKEGKKLVAKLKIESKGYPVEVKTDLSFDRLKNLYGQSKIFWSAAGFGFDEKKEPEKMEHFGMTTVEAMAAGCVPVVIAKGGQREIVLENKSGFLWKDKKELIKKTVKLINNQEQWDELSKKAQNRSKKFSQEKFFDEIKKLSS